MKGTRLKTVKLFDKNDKQKIANQILKEVELLKQFDPDKKLKEEFDAASLHDLKNI